MNPEESPTPKTNDEWWEDTPTESSTLKTQENLSTENDSALAAEAPTPLTQSQLDDVSLQSSTSTEEMQIEAPQEIATTQTPELSSELDLLSAQASQRIAELQATEAALKAEISQLQTTHKTLQGQVNATQTTLSKMVQESLELLEQRKQA
ncbi:MAG: DUF3086 domain-containing protein, partial [Nostocales cyanobacterium]